MTTAVLLIGFFVSLFFVVRELIRQNRTSKRIAIARMYLDRADRALRKEKLAIMEGNNAAYWEALREFNENMEQANQLIRHDE